MRPMNRSPAALLASSATLLALGSDARAQVAIDEDPPAKTSNATTSPAPATSGRVGALLGGLGPAVTEPARGAEAPEVPARTAEAMRRCFQDAVRREVPLPGRVEVDITLYNFDVTAVSLAQSDTMDLLTRECVSEAAQAADVVGKDGTHTWLFIPSAG